MPIRKRTSEDNTFLANNQQFLVRGLPRTLIMYKRDAFDSEIGQVEKADGTFSPTGRRKPGEVNVTFQFADPDVWKAYYEWHEQSIDQGDGQGINPQYKRPATIIFERLYKGSPGDFNTGRDLPDRKIEMIGCWLKKLTVPAGDIAAEEECVVEGTICWDDLDLNPQNSAN